MSKHLLHAYFSFACASYHHITTVRMTAVIFWHKQINTPVHTVSGYLPGWKKKFTKFIKIYPSKSCLLDWNKYICKASHNTRTHKHTHTHLIHLASYNPILNTQNNIIIYSSSSFANQHTHAHTFNWYIWLSLSFIIHYTLYVFAAYVCVCQCKYYTFYVRF